MADIVYKCLREKTYYDFIKEAVSRSDGIYITVDWPSNEFVFGEKQLFLDMGLTEEHYESCRIECEYQHHLNKTLFDSHTLSFLEKLKPFLNERSDFHSGNYVFSLKSTPEIIPILLEPKSMENWGFPYYPNDLSFSKDNKYFFICENHENNAMLFPNDQADYDFWSSLGVVFKQTFNYERDVLNRLNVSC